MTSNPPRDSTAVLVYSVLVKDERRKLRRK
jgi:hypothetical protein